MIHEDILHLSIPEKSSPDFLESARVISKRELEAALKTAEEEVKSDIQDGINKVDDVMPSQPYNA